ncbi:TRAP transporter small permease subunit [Limnobacter parvus]|uniref:TRAP transporter small permease protein n=1 Tax=Limnobacter parvus TaxID=2939690 RepID=A0ABT1XJG1_9BURK|nr:TRAP transporter small permease subunit [Limnobacter parvus]MCR2747016.1 TRAP transporter small permease subunit [Limnobacter parvus]
MNALLALSRRIDWLSAKVGLAVGWLILLTTVISAYNAVVRKAFDTSSNGLLEIQWYFFGAVFLLGAAYTLQQNEHVRIDVVSGRFSEKTRAWIDIVGHVLFTLPLIGFVVVSGWHFTYESFLVNEYSPDPGGLIRWPAKALIVVGFVLLGLQVCSEVIKKIDVLQNHAKGLATPCP